MNNLITADDSRPRCPPRQVPRPPWTTPTGSDVLDFANAVYRRNWLLREAAKRDHRWPNENNSRDIVSHLLSPTEALPVTGRAVCRLGCRVDRLLLFWHPNDKPDALRAMFNSANREAQRLDLGSVLCPTITGFMDEYRKLVDSAVHLFDGSPAYSGKPLSPMSLHSVSPLLHLIHELLDARPRLLVQLEKLKAIKKSKPSKPRKRTNEKRDAQFVAWRTSGLSDKEIMARWNADNPNATVDLPTIRQAIRRANQKT